MPKLSLKDARNFYRRGQYGASMANYTAILKDLPMKAPKLETEFLLCFEEFRQELRITNYSIDQINDYFLLFSNIFEFSAKFHVQWANFLSSNGLYEEASLCFMKSLKIQDANPELDASITEAAYSGLRSLKDHLVDQWHFRMLNDQVRNESYDQAIKLAIDHLKKQKQKVNVLDIGSGTAIFSMSAVKNGANGQVLAVEKSPLMCQVAEQVLILNGLETRVKIAEKHSSDLSLLDDMQGEKVDLIIAELMDAGFFGEDILSTLLDAKNRFLSNDGLMIPDYVEIFALAIESDEIRDENFCNFSQQQSTFDKQIFVKSYLTAKCQSLLDFEEPYDSRTLKSLKDYRILSKSAKIYSLCLNDTEKLSEIVDKAVSFDFDLEICTRGRVDAIVCCFVTKLFDSITISSSSDNDSCWEQAIFPICVNNAQTLEKVPLTATISDNRFEIILRKWQVPDAAVMICDPNVIKCLNDSESRRCYQKFLEHFQADSYSILDISSNPIIPILCGKILKNAKITSFSDKTIKYCIEKLSDNLDITFVAAKNMDFRLNFDAILIDPLDDVGLLKSDIFETTLYYKEKFKPKRILPNILQIHARLIESLEISSYSKVTCDERTLNFKIRDVINLFQVETFRDIEFSTSEYINLSDDNQIFDINFEESEFSNQNSRIEFTITSKGKIDAVLYWFEIGDSYSPEVAIKTIDSSNRYKQALFILKNPVGVALGDIVLLECVVEKSELSFLVEK